ncbi:MAG: ATP-binding protein [Acidobacteriota bacterium]
MIQKRGEAEVAVRCGCRSQRSSEARLAAARVPARFLGCTLESFELWDPSTPSLGSARNRTRDFVDCYPGVRKGLLYMGPAGIGKTHLSVAALKELVLTKNVRGLYANFLDLVQQLQMTFDGNGQSREEILGPVTEAEVLVLDELGAGKLSPWVMDLLYFVVNSRYMENRITLVTTNYTDHPKPAGQESLAERISVPLRSRLFEMCELVDMRPGDLGGDYRRAVLAQHRAR